jgi:hypothetical protein
MAENDRDHRAQLQRYISVTLTQRGIRSPRSSDYKASEAAEAAKAALPWLTSTTSDHGLTAAPAPTISCLLENSLDRFPIFSENYVTNAIQSRFSHAIQDFLIRARIAIIDKSHEK